MIHAKSPISKFYTLCGEPLKLEQTTEYDSKVTCSDCARIIDDCGIKIEGKETTFPDGRKRVESDYTCTRCEGLMEVWARRGNDKLCIDCAEQVISDLEDEVNTWKHRFLVAKEQNR